MAFNAKLVPAGQALGITGFTGAAPQTVAGNTILIDNVKLGSLSANVYAKATTNTLTITAKWQTSDDNSTWRDAYLANRPANVVVVTGTGSAVIDNISLSAPDCVYGHRYARCIAISGVGTGGGAGVDESNVSYAYQKWDFN
jgi:hypothetical protein